MNNYVNQPQTTFTSAEALWEEVGGNAITAPIMAAIAMAESNGNWWEVVPDPNATDPNAKSWGLWQINDSDVPGLIRAGIINSAADLLDPIKNAEAAYYIAGGNKLGGLWNWTTWKDYIAGKTDTRGWQVISQYLGTGPPQQYPGASPGGGGGGGSLTIPLDWKESTKHAIVWTVLIGFLVLGLGRLYGSQYK